MSCKRGIKASGSNGALFSVESWQNACARAASILPEQAKAFFEKSFAPYLLTGVQESKITGYYIPVLDGALERHGAYQWPVYGVPDDFAQPYLSRAEIDAGALDGRGLELVWLKDPVMQFFMHIQGSGHVRLPDGRVMTLQFAAKNGRPYTSIGRKMVEAGRLDAQEVSLQTIREYLYANPDQQKAIFSDNASYIFFALHESEKMPKGAQGVPLTPEHSIAIDPAYWPYGLPIYLDVEGVRPFQRLAITQDTGSAIRGETRADWFAGLGKLAGEKAGHLAANANWYLLLPKL